MSYIERWRIQSSLKPYEEGMKRPKGIPILAYALLVLGGLYLLGGVVLGLSSDVEWREYFYSFNGVKAALGVGSGLGLLKMKNWGRRLALVLLVLAVLSAVLSYVARLGHSTELLDATLNLVVVASSLGGIWYLNDVKRAFGVKPIDMEDYEDYLDYLPW